MKSEYYFRLKVEGWSLIGGGIVDVRERFLTYRGLGGGGLGLKIVW